MCADTSTSGSMLSRAHASNASKPALGRSASAMPATSDITSSMRWQGEGWMSLHARIQSAEFGCFL